MLKSSAPPWAELYPTGFEEAASARPDAPAVPFFDTTLTREVEVVIYEHPAVREAAVIGVESQYRGETVKAFVSLEAGATASPEEIVEHCRAVMAAYKYPRSVEIVDELPKTVTGMLKRRDLRVGADKPAAQQTATK